MKGASCTAAARLNPLFPFYTRPVSETGSSSFLAKSCYAAFERLKVVKIMRMRKTISTTEHPAIRQLSVCAPALLVVILFTGWVVWIIMKWIVLEDKFRLYCPDHFYWYKQRVQALEKLLDRKGKLSNKTTMLLKSVVSA